MDDINRLPQDLSQARRETAAQRIKQRRFRPPPFRIGALLIFLVVLLMIQIGVSLAAAQTFRVTLVAFMSSRSGDYEIYIIEPDGDNLRNISQNPAQDGVPGWSSQAKQLAFFSTRQGNQPALYSMNFNGMDVKLLDNSLTYAYGSPQWSPTGEWIAIDAALGETIDVHLVPKEGGQPRNVTQSAETMDRFGAWSPDGNTMIIVSDRSKSLALYALDIVSGEVSELTDSSYGSATPDWSPDGSKIAFTSERDGDVDVYVMDADGGNMTRMTDSPGFDGFPRWSPDGKYIAFVSVRDENPEIYRMNVDGSNVLNLTNNEALDAIQGGFLWSPDGSQILFSSDRTGDLDVYIMDADGENLLNLSEAPGDDFAAVWIP